MIDWTRSTTSGVRRPLGATTHRVGLARSCAVLVAAVTMATVACDSDASSDEDAVEADGDGDAVPSPGAEFFTDGDFEDIPKPRGATEASTKTERDGVISQSFTVTATSPQELMDVFSDQLPQRGWEIVEPVRSTGTDSLAAAWVRDDERLEISALLAQGVEDERSQFSIVLLPDRTPGEEISDADSD